jgi:hypothetical protein
MDAAETQEIRELFNRAERESDPRRKHAALEEALDLLDALIEDERHLSQSDRSLVRNLRRSNTRRLLSQLMAIRDVHFDVWFSYLSLLFFRLGPEVAALLKEDETVRTAYHGFIGLGGSNRARHLRRPRISTGMESRNAQPRQRGKRNLPARVWNNDQLEDSNVQELDTIVLGLARCPLRTEIPLLA